MRTVSLETAKKLKDVGLEWEPSWSDHFTDESGLVFNLPDDYVVGSKDEFTWLPTLPDLLEWLEGRGYCWNLCSPMGSLYKKKNFLDDRYECILSQRGVGHIKSFWNATAEDAVAKAVLWVLEQEAKKA